MAETTETGQTVHCAVMTSEEVDPREAEARGLFRDYEGKRYYFCCPGCAPKFDANPAQYATA